MHFLFSLISVCCLLTASAFQTTRRSSGSLSVGRMNLFMGRAAAVRAATKAKTDGAKAKNNNRYAKKIIMAVKAGGPEIDQNKQLENVIKEAKQNNVPMDLIKRNIDKASKTDQADFKESLFEFVGAGGIGFLVNVLTDNDNRAANDINLIGKKKNLRQGGKGSVAFNFDRMSRIDIMDAVLDEDTVLEMCLEADVDDFTLSSVVTGNPSDPQEDGTCTVYVDPSEMTKLRDALIAAEHTVKVSLEYVPKNGYKADLDEEAFEANLATLNAFEELDDVDSVAHDMDCSDGDE